jgi:UDP-N-acetylglucosamine 2-epimerase (non-hydrolysing)
MPQRRARAMFGSREKLPPARFNGSDEVQLVPDPPSGWRTPQWSRLLRSARPPAKVNGCPRGPARVDPNHEKVTQTDISRLLVVAGARPNFVKVAPILRAAAAAGSPATLVHTGQHYDIAMSEAFFADLGIPLPDFHLGTGGGSHADQTARVMTAFEPVLLEVAPQWVVVVGDVDSTLACALTAAKLRASRGCRVAHVEAGLRSGDWSMPEEINRVLTDRLSDLLLLPSRDALPNLLAEGIPADRAVFAGNVMIDSLFDQLPAARQCAVGAGIGVAGEPYAVVTLHRPSNVDDPDSLRAILCGLAELSRRMPVVFPVHPRTRMRITEFALEAALGSLITLEPLGYREMLSLVDGATVVLTDSGGLQEETTALGVPCVTLREQTERPVTIEQGTNRLAPWPLTSAGIARSAEEAAAEGRFPVGERAPEGWDGHAAERIVSALLSR